MAASAPGAPRKAAKDLACADCQRRKKRCDKQSPCSNCVKHNVPCIPSSPAPPRKRRQPMKELLERLAACEERLKHCNCHMSTTSPPPSSSPPSMLPQHQHHQHHHHQHQPSLPPLQRPRSHDHSHNGAPPSPPASAASRDAAIANMLDHDDDGEGFVMREKQQIHGITTARHFDYAHAAPGMTAGADRMGDRRASGS